MKRVLITGKDSYIGTSVEKWLKQEQFNGMYQIDTIDLRKKDWEKKSFSNYNTIFHVAGIAHQRETKENAFLYYNINRDLSVRVALKAQREGVQQFIFLSSMSVYGITKGKITSTTETCPKSHYGKSKLEAEQKLLKIAEKNFKVAILRPPIVYGPNCKGNYQILSKTAKKIPLFPKISNKRSMIYVENLSIFVQMIIDNKSSGIFLPQNKEYVCTSKMVKDIADLAGHSLLLVPIWGHIIDIVSIETLNKIFGSLYYEDFDSCEQFYGYKESLQRTEKDGEKN